MFWETPVVLVSATESPPPTNPPEGRPPSSLPPPPLLMTFSIHITDGGKIGSKEDLVGFVAQLLGHG